MLNEKENLFPKLDFDSGVIVCDDCFEIMMIQNGRGDDIVNSLKGDL